jgi:hypothetical protein
VVELKRSHTSVYLFFLPYYCGEWNSSLLKILCNFASCHLVVVHKNCNLGVWPAWHNKIYMLSSKIENAHWAEKTTTACRGIRETATTRNFVLWLFLNNRNTLWHVKICHDAKVVLWLLKELTTPISDFMKITQGVVIVNFTAATRCESSSNLPKGQRQHRQLASDRTASWCLLQPCLLIVWRFLVTKWRSWMAQVVVGACFLIKGVAVTFYG